MNLKDIRQAIFDSADWSPLQSSDAVGTANRFINRAYNVIAEDAPYLFFESQVKLATKADFSPGTGDTLEMTTVDDYWVLTRSAAGTTAGGWPTAAADDGDWDGRMIAITDPRGVVRRRRIRTMWVDSGTEYLTIDKPWPNITDTGMTYKVYSAAYYLPDDVIMVNSMRLYEDGKTWPLVMVGQLEAEDAGFVDTTSNSITGVPRYAFRRGHYKLPSPATAPVAAVTSDTGSFDTAEFEAPGTFRYIYTWVWGRRDDEVADMGPLTNASGGAPRKRPPMWESSPSPASALVTVARDQKVTLTIPPNPHLLGFGDDAGGRYQRTGWRARIYRRRESIDTATDAQTALEISDQYYLIGEQLATSSSSEDTGVTIPDYTRRLRNVHGYQSFGLHPWPDARYEVDVRCVRRPEPLVHDQDAPRLHPDAVEILIQQALAYMYEKLGDFNGLALANQRYQTRLSVLAKRYSDLQSSAVVTARRPARAMRGGRRQRRWYKLVTDSASWGPFG